ncbi:MAG: PAS domain S-box protein, partial [Chloroflexota bacterium]
MRDLAEQYQLLFESNPLPMWIYDREALTFLTVNNAAVDHYGYSRDEFLSMTLRDIHLPEAVPTLVEVVRRVRGTIRRPGAWTQKKKDGTLIEVEITTHDLTWGGRSSRLVLANDITARKQAEEALRQSEARYRAVVEDQTELICRYLPDGTHTFVNDAYCRYYGKEREELLHQSFLTRALPDERARLEKYLSSFTPENPVGTFEQYDVTPDGQVRWRMWTDRAIFDSQGRLVEFQATGRDITDRKQRERELEAIATVSAALRTASARADMLPIILDQLLELLHAEGAGLAMRDPLTGETVIERAIGKWSAWSGIRLPSGEGVSGQVIATGQPYISAHVETEPRMTHLDLLEGLRAVACIPLIAQGETIGALWIGRKDNITPDEVSLLTATADIAANAIRRTGLHEETRRRAEQ